MRFRMVHGQVGPRLFVSFSALLLWCGWRIGLSKTLTELYRCIHCRVGAAMVYLVDGCGLKWFRTNWAYSGLIARIWVRRLSSPSWLHIRWRTTAASCTQHRARDRDFLRRQFLINPAPDPEIAGKTTSRSNCAAMRTVHLARMLQTPQFYSFYAMDADDGHCGLMPQRSWSGRTLELQDSVYLGAYD